MSTSSQDWENSALGEYFRIKHGFAFKGRFFAEEGDYIVLTPGNFKPDGGLKLKGDREKYYTGDFPHEYILRRDDLLIVMTDLKQDAPILGSPAFIPEDDRFLHNQRLGKIIDLDESRMDWRFLYYLLNSYSVRAQIKASATGATVRHTAPSRLYDVEVWVPPLRNQRKIAAVLSAYDDLIENNTRRIAVLEEMAQAIYREWFVHFRFPDHEQVAMVDSSLGPIPEGWEVVTVENTVMRFPTGRKYNSKTVFPEGKVPVLDQGRSGIIGYHNDEPGFTATEEDPVIVFANHTCYQRIVLFSFSAIQNVIPFRPSLERPRDIFWLHWATKDLIEFNDYKGHWPEFMAKQLPLPPAELCAAFGGLVRPLVRLSHQLEKRSDNLRRTRDLLLPRLVSGEIDVSDLSIDGG
jgi:type I restriction enzyme S subunit